MLVALGEMGRGRTRVRRMARDDRMGDPEPQTCRAQTCRADDWATFLPDSVQSDTDEGTLRLDGVSHVTHPLRSEKGLRFNEGTETSGYKSSSALRVLKNNSR